MPFLSFSLSVSSLVKYFRGSSKRRTDVTEGFFEPSSNECSLTGCLWAEFLPGAPAVPYATYGAVMDTSALYREAWSAGRSRNKPRATQLGPGEAGANLGPCLLPPPLWYHCCQWTLCLRLWIPA